MNRDRILLIAVVSGFAAAAGVVVATHSLPEENAKNFNALSNLSMVSDFRIIKNATLQDNTFIYAINGIAAKGVDIALRDPSVQQILSDSKGRAVTIAGVQPTVFQDNSGKLEYDSAGQVVITSNWQDIAGQHYESPLGFSEISGRAIDSHQEVWNVAVDIDRGTVVNLQADPERLVTGTIQTDQIVVATDMFIPDTVEVTPGTEVTWSSQSFLQHNVVGSFVTQSGKQIHIDSGFFGNDGVFKYKFDEPGVFNYECTIHSQAGMKGSILVRDS